MNELEIFENEKFGKLRTVEINGEPWFVGKDVAEALGYEKARNAIAIHVESDDALKWGIPDNMGREQETTVINESGVYSLVFGSKLESAKEFKRWITHEVIPAIRKHGGYLTPQKIEEVLLNPDTIITLATQLKEEREKNAEQAAIIEAQKPKALFADAVSASDNSILIGNLAKLIRQNGVPMGQKRLFQWMRENGYLMSTKGARYNLPTQYSMEKGLFEIKERTIVNPDESTRTILTTLVTGKGQIHFLNKFLGEKKE